MKATKGMAFFGAIALLGWTTAAYAQSSGEKPKIVVGDQWEFTRSATPPGGSSTWSREVIEVPGDDRLRVKLETGTLADYDGAMDFMPEGRLDFRRQLVAYPLTVGKEWPIDRRFTNPGTSETGKAKVAAQEQITVPAGTFQCYRIEAESSTVNKANYSARRIWKRWYCPDVKWIAKEVLESTIFDRNNPGANGMTVETSELVRFTPGK
jgi:hypothetical protein